MIQLANETVSMGREEHSGRGRSEPKDADSAVGHETDQNKGPGTLDLESFIKLNHFNLIKALL